VHIRTRWPTRGALGRWTIALAVAAAIAGACSNDSSPEPGPRSADASQSEEELRAGHSTTTVELVDTPGVIAPLDTDPFGEEVQDWRGLKSDGQHLYAHHDLDDERWRLVRFDPEDGRVVAEVAIDKPHGWAVHPEAHVVVEADRQTVTLRDPLTLEVRHRIDLGDDTRADLTSDMPSGERYWLPLRRYNEDFLNGIVSAIGVARLDLANGEVLERRDTEPCGTRSAVELGGVLVMGMECTFQVAALDLASGGSELFDALPSGAQLMIADTSAVMRWSRFAVIGRWRPGDTELTTLDLAADLPPVLTVVPLVDGPRGVWAVTEPVDTTQPWVLHLVDRESFEVVARAEVESTVAFIDADGFTITDGVLARWDPAALRGGAPAAVNRAPTGAPNPVEPTSPDERAAIEAFRTVWTPSVPNETAAVSMIDAEQMLPIRSQLIDLLDGRADSVDVVPTAIAVDGDLASLTYVFLLDGRVAFVPLSATLERVEGTWMVTPESVCRLASQAPTPRC